ncbi:ATP-dependent endonuclease [Sporomusa aerivorans]|uniref:ATP-dependent nuclease n=1 Tax=Sporomusa aerivorans TaxID=204936 RepID=UPI00352BA82F
MYLQKLVIKNYRCFDEKGIEIYFKPDINVIIGENNIGKTATIDALRLAFSLGGGRRELYVTPQDFHVNKTGEPANMIALDLTFADLSEKEQATFYEMLIIKNEITAQLQIRYERDLKLQGLERIKTTVWGGELEGQSISFQILELLNHIFLGALRDAESDLRPGKGNRLGQLLRKVVVGDDDKQSILEHVRQANRKIINENSVRKAGEIINRNLKEIEKRRLKQNIQLGLIPPDFNKVADSLQTLLVTGKKSLKLQFEESEWKQITTRYDVKDCPTEKLNGKVLVNLDVVTSELIGQDFYDFLLENANFTFDLHQNGLGYNNIIYIATVLGDLIERKNIEAYTYNALLIEEPEAHLHPQLQDLLFTFFTNRLQNGAEASPIQLFITSHSPTLTSKAQINNVMVFHEDRAGNVAVTSLSNCPLLAEERADLKRYLDVTKSQLFFSKGIILVEGISEALLLPVLAKRLGCPLDENAIEIVNIDGVAFEPFVKLFNAPEKEKRINIPCIVVTDDDRCTDKTEDGDDDSNEEGEPEASGTAIKLSENDLKLKKADIKIVIEKLRGGKPSARAVKAKTFDAELVTVSTAFKTFEYELAKASRKNINVIMTVLKTMQPKNYAWILQEIEDKALSDEEAAVLIWLAVRKEKGIFSQKLAAKIEEVDENGVFKHEFIIPNYLQKVFEMVCPTQLESVRDVLC